MAKVCSQCKQELPRESFNSDQSRKDKLQVVCKGCKKLWRKKHSERLRLDQIALRRSKPELYLLKAARTRAKKKGLPFNLEVEDIIIPTICPVFGRKLFIGVGERHEFSPSLDKIIPKLGYVKGNIRVISWRANRIKSDGSLKELQALCAYILENTNVN